MKLSSLISISLVSLALAAAISLPVWAQLDFDPGISSLPSGEDPQAKVAKVIVDIINMLLGFSAVLAVGAIIWGAIMFIISIGNEKRVETAKKIIFWAVVGLLVVGMSFLIVRFVGQTLGVPGVGAPAGGGAGGGGAGGGGIGNF